MTRITASGCSVRPFDVVPLVVPSDTCSGQGSPLSVSWRWSAAAHWLQLLRNELRPPRASVLVSTTNKHRSLVSAFGFRGSRQDSQTGGWWVIFSITARSFGRGVG